MPNLLIQQAITVSTDAYTANDCIGGLQTIEAPRLQKPSDLVINSITISDAAGQKAAMNIIFFKVEPDDSTLTDNAAIDIDDAELKKVTGYVSIAADDYIDFADNSVACVTAVGLPIDSDSDDLYFTIQAVGTPTYAAVTDLQITIGLL